MRFNAFDIAGPLEIVPNRIGDERGYFSEIFREDRFTEHVALTRFVQENQSLSARIGTLRGLHFQRNPAAQGKLVRCIVGAIFDVAVDLRHDSPTYGRWVAAELSAVQGNQLWVPSGFAHGFCTLLADTMVSYKVTSYYSPENDCGVAWNDPDIAVQWPDVVDIETLSGKDRIQPSFRDLPPCFSMEG
jgi:dTDP-4-dehydrorhamnose 3,5-epimerase